MDVWELRPLCLQGYNTSSLHRKTKVHVSWYKGTLCRYGSLILVAGKISRWIYVHHQYDMPHSETTNTPVSSHTLQVQKGWVIKDSSKTANWGDIRITFTQRQVTLPNNQSSHFRKVRWVARSQTINKNVFNEGATMIMTSRSTFYCAQTKAFLNASDSLTISRP